MWPEIRRKFGCESSEAKAAREQKEQTLREKHRQEEEQFAEETIYGLYVNSQETYSAIAQQMRGLTHQASELTLPGARESLARIRFNSMRSIGRSSDELLELAEETILRVIQASTERKKEIKVSALGKALGYWQTRLEQPDLPPEESIFGHQRATRIQSRLESLSNPGRPDVK